MVELGPDSMTTLSAIEACSASELTDVTTSRKHNTNVVAP
jgi:hypothetical protein